MKRFPKHQLSPNEDGKAILTFGQLPIGARFEFMDRLLVGHSLDDKQKNGRRSYLDLEGKSHFVWRLGTKVWGPYELTK